MIRKLIVGFIESRIGEGAPRQLIIIKGQKIGEIEITEINNPEPGVYEVYGTTDKHPVAFLWKKYENQPVVVEYESYTR